jgi:spore germination protein KC
VNQQVNRNIERIVKTAVTKAQKVFKTDFIGFGSILQKSHPRQWEHWRKNWNELFVQAPVSVHVDYKIRRIGTITNALLGEVK